MIKVSYEKLMTALEGIEKAVAKQPTKPILGSVIVSAIGSNRLNIMGTDLSTAIAIDIPVENDGREDSRFLFDMHYAEKFLKGYKTLMKNRKTDTIKIAQNPEGNIEFQIDEKRKLVMRTYDPEMMVAGAYELLENMYKEISGLNVTLNTERFFNAVEKLIPFSASDSFMRNLNTLYVEVAESGPFVRLITADGFRMGIYDLIDDRISRDLADHFLLERSGIEAMLKAYKTGVLGPTMEIVYDGTYVNIISGETRIRSRVVDAEFPDYKRVLPRSTTTAISLKSIDDTIEAFKRLKTVADAGADSIRFSINGSVKVVAICPEYGEMIEGLNADHEGSDLEIVFNPKFLIEALTSFKKDKAKTAILKSGGSDAPLLIESNELPGVQHVVMPIRLI